MLIKWLRERQYTNWGLIETGETVDTEKKGIPDEAIKPWIRDKWCKEIKPDKEEKKKSK